MWCVHACQASHSYIIIMYCTWSLSQLIDEQVLCVHGGLSPDIKTLDQIRTIERNQEIPHKGAFCDLVWSDPEDVDTWAISPRGAGWLFGSKVTNEVLGCSQTKKESFTCEYYNSNAHILFSLFTLTTSSSSVVHINWSMKATSLCLTRSWWLCGRHQTTATDVETLRLSWSSRMSTDESPSCFALSLTLSVSYLPEQPHHTSFKGVLSSGS